MERPRLTTVAGFTLIEVLASVVIVAVGLTALAPALALAALSRIQSQKIETATQLANLEIDRIRALVDKGGSNYKTANDTTAPNVCDPTRLPLVGDDPGTSFASLGNVPAPTVISTTDCTLYDPNTRIIDDTPSGVTTATTTPPSAVTKGTTNKVIKLPNNAGFYVLQTFRSTGSQCRNSTNTGALTNNDPNRPCAFRLIVRVYDSTAFDQTAGTTTGPLSSLPISSSVTSLPSGLTRYRTQPLVVMTSEIGSPATLPQFCRIVPQNTPGYVCPNL